MHFNSVDDMRSIISIAPTTNDVASDLPSEISIVGEGKAVVPNRNALCLLPSRYRGNSERQGILVSIRVVGLVRAPVPPITPGPEGARAISIAYMAVVLDTSVTMISGFGIRVGNETYVSR
jgi:hypothetical protein